VTELWTGCDRCREEYPTRLHIIRHANGKIVESPNGKVTRICTGCMYDLAAEALKQEDKNV
jgi:hypothetical protein